MKKNIVTYSLVILIVIAIIVAGYFMVKPNHENINGNPYSMKIDSLDEIAPENFLPVSYSNFHLQGSESKAIAVNQNNEILVGIDKLLRSYDSSGNQISEFSAGINATALTCSNNKIIAAFENEIRIYETNGKLLKSWKMQNPESYITSLAVVLDKIYAADAQLTSIYKYSFDGDLLGVIGQKTDKKDLSFFVIPSYYFDVAQGADQSVWVANTGRHKLVQFDSEGSIMMSWGKTSSAVDGFCGCCNPSHFAVLSDGSFITSEKGLVRVKKYNKNGEFAGVLAGPEKFQDDTKGLDIAVDKNDIIYILEPSAMKVHVFELKNLKK